MVSQGMGQFYPGINWTGYYRSGAPDLAGLSKSLGANPICVTDAAALGTALTAALAGAASAPQVVVVTVDPAAEPPYYVPAGT
jgi:thiamine pyrophosphate-dependent acetolactate synthase large subunit-like protein